MDNSQWLSVKDIVSKYKKFNVPSLQRTYRWGEKEITLLLNDLYEFYNTNEDSTNDFYPLQPLILKKSNKNDDTWNVLDGQQRLTTIKLIASFLKMDKDYCLDISYDTREKTKDFLGNISNKKEEDVGKSMELYYIFHAYEVIKWKEQIFLKYSFTIIQYLSCLEKMIWSLLIKETYLMK